MLKNSSILITGGTGSFGSFIIPKLLNEFNPKRLVIFSRDEMKQWEMAKTYGKDERVRFFIGDIRDKERLMRALNGIDYVIHAAATKIVPTAEYNPFECIKTNIIGAMNLIEASIDKKVKRVVALSTDKASSPVNLYCATKLASDKLFISGNSYSGGTDTRFSVVRYGNVMASRGSVIPLFLSQGKSKEVLITDRRMTRFMITLDEASDLVTHVFEDMTGGEIYVRKNSSMNIVDIATACAPNAKQKIIGIRPGEKLHEQMIGLEDAPYTYEYPEYFKILPSINDWSIDPERIGGGKKVSPEFTYTSNNNTEWMTIKFLQSWIKNNL
jgi:UDP-N-acetylglucosamine 4,6-dehydratase (inverting)